MSSGTKAKVVLTEDGQDAVRMGEVNTLEITAFSQPNENTSISKHSEEPATFMSSEKTGSSQPIKFSDPTPLVCGSECPDLANNLISDTSDAKRQGFGFSIMERPNAIMPVSHFSREYNMQHKRRGLALILVHEHFVKGGPSTRHCARHDANICKKAFKHLGFEVQEYWNLDKISFSHQLCKVSQLDHTDSDGLAVVFMSHGGVNEKTNKEFIWTYDAKVDTTELWKNFNAEKCPSLAGKPKMFFIQACRGEETDKGVCLKRPKGLSVQTDSQKITEEYVIPENADMLMMWASYPGMYAFKSGNKGLNGSVFLHFLAQVLTEDAQDEDLASVLLRVTREVAIHYESYVPGDEILHRNKQIPYTGSTLMRKVYFFQKKIDDDGAGKKFFVKT